MGCEVKEVSDFYNIYAQYIPNCSILVSAERKNKRFYGELFCKHNGSYKIRGDDLKHRGCKNCKRKEVKDNYDKKWAEDCEIIHSNKYDYTETIVGDVLKRSNIRCRACDKVFKQTPASHKTGRGCPICSSKQSGINKRKDIIDVEVRAINIGFNYDFSKSVYITCKDDIEIICDKGHTFFQSPDELVNARHGCNICSKSGKSKAEKELFDFISQYYKCQANNRKVLKGKELDIYIPSIKMGIEYNGLYWHSDSKIKTSHFEKLNLSAKKDTHIIFIYENDWVNRQEATKNKIKDLLKIKEKDFYEVCFVDLDITEDYSEEIVKYFNEASLERFIKKYGYYVMRLQEKIVGIASFITYKGDKLITEILRPIDSTQTDYYTNFIKYFQNKEESFRVLASLDWLDDLYLNNLSANFENLIKPKKLYIHGQELFETPPRENLECLTKARYAIYKL